MTSRTVLRNNDLASLRDAQRPINEAFRDVTDAVKAMPRRSQAWVRFTMPLASAGVFIRCPNYPIASVQVLSAVNTASSTSAISGAPWIAVEPVEGSTAQLRVNAVYGLLASGVIDVLCEFVENVAPAWPKSNVTGGQP